MLSRKRFRSTWGAAAVLVTISLASAAPTETCAEDLAAPSPEKGYELAQWFCKGCHLIEDNAGATIPVGVPTFRSIANRPGQTGQRIINALIQPHAPMPDIHLTSEEILNIVAYLETLRTDKSIPPLLSPTNQGPKPKYPERS